MSEVSGQSVLTRKAVSDGRKRKMLIQGLVGVIITSSDPIL